jgi:serine/threonine-protein kinase HipA
VVAGDHDHADAGVGAGTHCLSHTLPHRVLEREQAGESESILRFGREPLRAGQFARRASDWALGQDLPGALQIVPTDGSTAVPDDETGTAPSTTNTTGEALRFSLAGVQLKFSAVQKATGGLAIPANGTGGSWIVKLPSQKFAGVPENEFAMMELARSVGIDVPETKLVPIKEIQGLPDGIEVLGDKAFAIKRFDRESDGLIFNALIGNADMHLKNWSLIYPDTRTAELAPAYDFVSAIVFMPDNDMALSFVDSKAFASLTRDQFVRFAAWSPVWVAAHAKSSRLRKSCRMPQPAT